jgi:hypothetical protein
VQLAETQAAIRAAVFGDGAAEHASGATPARRLAIHRRHYRASLIEALTSKFPATVWLMGPAAFSAAVSSFVNMRPPRAPCIAEYGEDFPEYIAGLPVSARAPYLAPIATADWLLGQVSIAISAPAMPITALASVPEGRLPDVRLTLQPGLRFQEADWPIDTLIRLHLSGNPPEQFVMQREHVWLQFHGARGKFSIDRLDAATLAFRRAVADGAPLGAAVEAGVAQRADIDPGSALAGLFASGLVIRADQVSWEDAS